MIPNPYLGVFISFEGTDGSGKSYLYEPTVDWLRETGASVEKVKEPGKDRRWGKRIYEELHRPEGFHKTDPIGFQSWYAIDSKENYVENVIPKLEQGYVVAADRSRLSGVCYGVIRSGLVEKGVREAMLRLIQINEGIIGEHFIWPDLCLIFDAEPELCLKRLKSKGVKLDAFETKEKIAMVRANYRSFIDLFPASRAVLIDNNGRPEEEVLKDVKDHIEKLLARKGEETAEA
jgi:dTMP kinase